MNRYIEPSETSFEAAEAAAVDVLDRTCAYANTKSGSVVRELVVRPMAYLYAWLRDNMENMRRQTSAVYLKDSQLTDNQMADDLASNYFIVRRQGANARGVVTLRVNSPFLQLPRGASFAAGDVGLQTTVRIVAGPGLEPRAADGVLYVRMAQSGDDWLVPVPVQAVDAGPVEVRAGEQVQVQFNLSSLLSATLTSSVTGGYGTETDAQLMARAEAATAGGGVGSYYGLKKLLDAGPVSVLSLAVASGEDAVLRRARRTSVNINPGGVVDCYVKTQNQPSVAQVSATAVAGEYDVDGTTWGYRAELPTLSDASVPCHGAICVSGAPRTSAGVVDEFAVEYVSTADNLDGQGARLGVHQGMLLYFNSSEPVDTVSASLLYMPGLRDLQDYMDRRDNRFVGQSTEVRAAVPVTLTLDCMVEHDGWLDDTQADAVRQAIANYVNGLDVGVTRINFSDIRRYCVTALSGQFDLRLPCTMSASVPMPDGGVDSFYSTSGVLDLATSTLSERWNPGICYFNMCKADIRIEQA